jgi:hypothetical protein
MDRCGQPKLTALLLSIYQFTGATKFERIARDQLKDDPNQKRGAYG